MIKDKELRGYIGAGVIFFLVMGLLLFLAFYEIPETNNDIFKALSIWSIVVIVIVDRFIK